MSIPPKNILPRRKMVGTSLFELFYQLDATPKTPEEGGVGQEIA